MVALHPDPAWLALSWRAIFFLRVGTHPSVVTTPYARGTCPMLSGYANKDDLVLLTTCVSGGFFHAGFYLFLDTKA